MTTLLASASVCSGPILQSSRPSAARVAPRGSGQGPVLTKPEPSRTARVAAGADGRAASPPRTEGDLLDGPRVGNRPPSGGGPLQHDGVFQRNRARIEPCFQEFTAILSVSLGGVVDVGRWAAWGLC